jgi:hypothetical protein
MWGRLAFGFGAAALMGAACGGSVTVFGEQTAGAGGTGSVASAGQGAASASQSAQNATSNTAVVASVQGTTVTATSGTATVAVSSGTTVTATGTTVASTSVATSSAFTSAVTVGPGPATAVSSSASGMSCSHPNCETGDPLNAGCDKCTAAICMVDSYCCDTYWDEICVGEVASVCMQKCPGMAPDCTTQYQGGTPGFQLCSRVNYECAFAFESSKLSCFDICQNQGGECLGTFDDVKDAKCKYGGQSTCHSTGLGTAICVCSRGCGGSDACQPKQVCSGGKCQ